jgi:hypothetical protein
MSDGRLLRRTAGVPRRAECLHLPFPAFRVTGRDASGADLSRRRKQKTTSAVPQSVNDRWATGRAPIVAIARPAGQRTLRSRSRRAAARDRRLLVNSPSLQAAGTRWGHDALKSTTGAVLVGGGESLLPAPSGYERRCLNPRLSPFPVSPTLIPDGGISPVRLEARTFPHVTFPFGSTA